jgi:TetR/AcrR family transcriptional regulator, transcriptional repressor for nem operon
MKVTKEKAAENRASLVRAASKLFRKKGIDGIGVADISKEAGLTHGALYAQFASKDELAAEALAYGFNKVYDDLVEGAGEGATAGDYLDAYVSKKHRDAIAVGCPAAASGSEVARQDKTVSRSFAAGIERTAAAYLAALGDAPIKASDRERALALAAAQVGAIVVARGIAKSNPRLSEEIISAARTVLRQVAGERRTPKRRKN